MKAKVLLSMALLSSAWFSNAQAQGSISNILNLRAPATSEQAEADNIRTEAVETAGLVMGSRAGFNEAVDEIEILLGNSQSYLNGIFDFSRVVVIVEHKHIVVPPVVREYGAWAQIRNQGLTKEETDKTFEISSPARLSIGVPSWRDYLIFSKMDTSSIDARLFPRTPEEVKVWETAVRQGWKSGLEQAQKIFRKQLLNLTTDLQGMALYRELVRLNVLNEMFVASNELGITTDTNTLSVSGRTVRITLPSRFNSDAENWKPIFIRGNYLPKGWTLK